MVDGEGAQRVCAGVGVHFYDEPGGGVGDPEVDYFAGGYEVVEGVHYFGDRGCVVVEVDVVLVDCWSPIGGENISQRQSRGRQTKRSIRKNRISEGEEERKGKEGKEK